VLDAGRSGIIARMRFASASLALATLFLASACEGHDSADAGADASSAMPDARVVADAGRDAGGEDASVALDASPSLDGASADGGFDPAGTITGSCGVLDDEILDASPFFVDDVMTFDEPWTSADSDRVSEGARQILMNGTAGGSSGYSEAFAFEVLHRCEGAAFVKSETEIVYDTAGSITDILVAIDGQKVGVSVTRAVTVTGACMRDDTYTEAAAEELLTRKLAGINESTMNVSAADRWVKQILFVFADTAAHEATLRGVWDGLDEALRADTILYVTVSEGMDDFIYFEDRCG
jgi:hypothetical protein